MGEPAIPYKYSFGYKISAKPKSANFKVNSIYFGSLDSEF